MLTTVALKKINGIPITVRRKVALRLWIILHSPERFAITVLLIRREKLRIETDWISPMLNNVLVRLHSNNMRIMNLLFIDNGFLEPHPNTQRVNGDNKMVGGNFKIV